MLGLLLFVSGARCLAQAGQLVLPEGSRIRVRLEQNLTSATAEVGQPVQLSVTEDVRVGDTVVIKQGAAAVGTITEAVHKRRLGRAGKLDFSVDRVVAADSTSIPLRYNPIKKDGGSRALATGIITGGAAVAFWPAAPFFLLIQGKDVTLHRGIEVDVFTDQTFTPRSLAALAYNGGGGTPVPVQVTSQPGGAEIYVDGSFVGSTPATFQMAPGPHRISVKRGMAVWERDLQVQAGTLVPVNAILSR